MKLSALPSWRAVECCHLNVPRLGHSKKNEEGVFSQPPRSLLEGQQGWEVPSPPRKVRGKYRCHCSHTGFHRKNLVQPSIGGKCVHPTSNFLVVILPTYLLRSRDSISSPGCCQIPIFQSPECFGCSWSATTSCPTL